MDTTKHMKWTIIGGGNGGQTTAGDLGSKGFDVTLYDIFAETIDQVNAQGGIYLEGAITGFGKVSKATTNIEEALMGADIVLVTVPATAHETVAKACAPYLSDGQIVVMNPAATFGSLVFRKVLDDAGCEANITIAETNTLLYGCRIIETGRVHVFGLKNRILTAALPAVDTNRVVSAMQQAFPQFEATKSILVTSFDNTNPILHPATTIFSTGLIESGKDWKFYIDGFTPSVGKYIEGMDQERIDIGKALGVKLDSCLQQLEIEYDVFEDNLSDAIRANPVYEDIQGQHTLETRYLTEDIPMGLVPFVELGKLLQMPVQRMEAVIQMGELLLEQDLQTGARTLKNLGIDQLTTEQFLNFLQTGEK